MSSIVQAATLDCVVSGPFGHPDKHVQASLMDNKAQLNLGKAAQYQVTASALGELVLVVAEAGDQRLSSSDIQKTNLRIESAGVVSEYFCSVSN